MKVSVQKLCVWTLGLWLGIAGFHQPGQADQTPSLASPAASTSTLLAAFEEVLQRVVSLRQLPLREPVARAVRSRADIRFAIQELIGQELTPDEWNIERDSMIQWGLIAPDFHLKDFVVDLLTEQAAGYYDPKQRQFFIADWLPPEVQEPVMAHELVHALQDQHYDLQANFDLVKDWSDLTMARKALIEGDATAIMLTYMLEPLGMRIDQLPDMETLLQAGAALLGEQFQVYTNAPLVLRQQLVFPYVHGLAFVKAALTQGGWPGMARLYQRPPLSTEHILHPEKYFTTFELPGQVLFAVTSEQLPENWSRRKQDVLGEFFLTVILQQFLPEAEAKQSAAGWHGDRYELWKQTTSGRMLLVCVTAWDTLTDAMEFWESYARLVPRKYPAQALVTEGRSALWQQGDRQIWLYRAEHMVYLIEGATAEELPRLQAVLKQATVVPRVSQPLSR